MQRKGLEWAHETFGEDIRVPMGIDSLVTCGASNKGRSSSRALNAEYRRGLGMELAAGVRGGQHFAPTRFNPGDAPSCFREIPRPVARFPPWWTESGEISHALMDLGGASRCRREVSAWAELVFKALARSEGCRSPGRLACPRERTCRPTGWQTPPGSHLHAHLDSEPAESRSTRTNLCVSGFEGLQGKTRWMSEEFRGWSIPPRAD